MIARNLPVPVPESEVFRRWPIGGLANTKVGLIGHYDATTEAYGHLDPCPTWHDRSGLGNDLTQTGTPTPTFMTAQWNDLQMVSFDGIDDFLTLTPTGWDGAQEATIIAVHQIVTPGAFNMICSARNNASSKFVEHRENGTGTLMQVIGGGGANPVQGSTAIDGAAHISIATYRASDKRVEIYEGATLENQTTETGAGDIETEIITVGGRGASLFYAGKIGELWIYARRLTPAEIAAKVTSLAAKWNL